MTGLVLPVLTLAAALLLDLLPLPGTAAPALLPAILYHWRVEQPERLPPIVTFAFGILADALGGLPLGVTAAALLLAQGLLAPCRRWLRRQGWLVLWLGFLAFAALVAALRWTLLAILAGAFLPAAAVVAETGLSVLAFPGVAGLLALLPRSEPATARATARG